MACDPFQLVRRRIDAWLVEILKSLHLKTLVLSVYDLKGAAVAVLVEMAVGK